MRTLGFPEDLLRRNVTKVRGRGGEEEEKEGEEGSERGRERGGGRREGGREREEG